MGTFSDKCTGQWREILSGLGMESSYLSGKPGPCPLCKTGTDRWVFDNKDGSGSWFCRRCGNGYGFKLVRLYLGLPEDDWQTVTAKISAFLWGQQQVEKASVIPGNSDLDKFNRLQQLWAESTIDDGAGLVSRYLRGRGLAHNKRLTYHGSLYWIDEATGRSGHSPGMIARVLSHDDRLVSIHRTFLDPRTGRKLAIRPCKKLMPSLPGVAGGAIRLFDVPDGSPLGVAEGIETALSAAQMFSVPVWSCISTSGVESFVPPKNVGGIIVYADNDRNAAGQLAAFKLQARLDKLGIMCEVKIPTLNDWNDQIEEMMMSAERLRGEIL